MGIDISGGMIIGANADEVRAALNIDEDADFLGEIYEMGWESYSYYFDAGYDSQVAGILIGNVNPLNEDGFSEWIEDVKNKAKEFYDKTGIEPELIGMQNVY